MRLVTTSFVPIHDHPLSTGGVPRWNRDFRRAFPEAVHHSFWDVPGHERADGLPEWEKARALNAWLLSTGRVTSDDVVVTDGFWGLGLEHMAPRVVSVAHGIWSHLTRDDVDAGRQPEFPAHHAVQVDYRRRHLAAGGRVVAVSDFVADQMRLQWGFDVPTIDNGIDLAEFRPAVKSGRDRRLVIHGVTTANKGLDHIEAVRAAFPDDRVMLLDHAAAYLGIPKYETLAQADIVVQPSAYEGNSFFILECLACNVPIVAYNVGLLYHAYRSGASSTVGWVMDRADRSPAVTVDGVRILTTYLDDNVRRPTITPRRWVSQYGIQDFVGRWRLYMHDAFGVDGSAYVRGSPER